MWGCIDFPIEPPLGLRPLFIKLIDHLPYDRFDLRNKSDFYLTDIHWTTHCRQHFLFHVASSHAYAFLSPFYISKPKHWQPQPCNAKEIIWYYRSDHGWHKIQFLINLCRACENYLAFYYVRCLFLLNTQTAHACDRIWKRKNQIESFEWCSHWSKRQQLNFPFLLIVLCEILLRLFNK